MLYGIGMHFSLIERHSQRAASVMRALNARPRPTTTTPSPRPPPPLDGAREGVTGVSGQSGAERAPLSLSSVPLAKNPPPSRSNEVEFEWRGQTANGGRAEQSAAKRIHRQCYVLFGRGTSAVAAERVALEVGLPSLPNVTSVSRSTIVAPCRPHATARLRARGR